MLQVLSIRNEAILRTLPLIRMETSNFEERIDAARLSDVLHDEQKYPPTYSESDPSMQTWIDELKATVDKGSLPITNAPKGGWPKNSRLLRKAVGTYFSAIGCKQDEVVALFIGNGIVTANTTCHKGFTPLLAAVSKGNVRTVRGLMDFGANVNAYGRCQLNRSNGWMGVERTPLQLAASEGNLTLVKLLIEVYHADDATIAPDGQLALRLAVDNGHKEIAAYLPARRGGGWLRWKAHYAKAFQRVKYIWREIKETLEIFLWIIPKYLFWKLPKGFLLWLKKDWHMFPKWCKKQISSCPDRMMRLGKSVMKAVRATPKIMKTLALRFWALFKTIASGLVGIVKRMVSLLHSALHAITTFFKRVTLRDLAQGLQDLASKILTDLPKAIGKGFKMLLGGCYQTIQGLAECLWLLATWFPKQFLNILRAMGSSVVTGSQELFVCIHPKGGMRASK